MPAKIQKVPASGARTTLAHFINACPPPPPIIETCRKIGNIVGIFVVKHTCIYAGPPSASLKKCYESNYNVLIRNIFYQQSCRRGDSLSEKYCPWPPPPPKKNMGPTTPLLCYPFQLCLKNTTEIYDDILILSRFYQQIGNDITIAMSFWNNLSLNFIG